MGYITQAVRRARSFCGCAGCLVADGGFAAADAIKVPCLAAVVLAEIFRERLEVTVDPAIIAQAMPPQTLDTNKHCYITRAVDLATLITTEIEAERILGPEEAAALLPGLANGIAVWLVPHPEGPASD